MYECSYVSVCARNGMHVPVCKCMHVASFAAYLQFITDINELAPSQSSRRNRWNMEHIIPDSDIISNSHAFLGLGNLPSLTLSSLLRLVFDHLKKKTQHCSKKCNRNFALHSDQINDVFQRHGTIVFKYKCLPHTYIHHTYS